MARGAKPGKAKGEAKRPVARKSLKTDASRVRDLEMRLAEALKREAEALEQQTATSEILRVISSSPTDMQPVLDAVAASAARLCEAFDAAIWRRDGDRVHLAAHHGAMPEEPIGKLSLPLVGSFVGRSVLDGRTIHSRNVQAEVDEFPATSEHARRIGFRAVLCVPLMREGVAIGSIALRRTEAELFTDRQVALLQTFADQAVIAIENVRLFKELEARNRDLTATSEILRVIASSPTDLQPVLDALADSAARLCESFDSAIFRRDGERLLLVAHHGPIPVAFTLPLVRGSVNGRAVLDGRAVHVADLQAEADEFPEGSALTRGEGVHAHLSVPLMREGVAIGTINLRRTEAQLFTERQVALLQTFADQAVIAIENVRLFKELQEKNHALTAAHAQVTNALEQQTATSEILQVISQSPTETQPVFETIVRNAVRLCGADDGGVYRFDGQLVHSVAHDGLTPEELETWRTTWPRPVTAAGVACQAIRTKKLVRIADIETAPELSDLSPEARANLQARGCRSVVGVPMRRQNDVVGAISITHRQVDGFSDAHLELLRTFADQAVIAIENVRLFKELEARNKDLTEALEQQTATADVLRVISSSPTNLQPVIDTVVRSAARFCGAYDASIFRLDGDHLRCDAHYGPVGQTHGLLLSVGRETVGGRTVLERRVIHVADLPAETAEFPEAAANARRLGFRTILSVPLVREGVAIGAIQLRRAEASPFTDKQITLLKTFADQAVIAIENVRLFKELQARTGELTRSVDQLTALGEISQAVSSTLDVETVLQTIVSRASQLAGADGCAIYEYDDATEAFHIRATHNLDPALVETLRAAPLRKGEGAMGRAAETREPTQVADIAAPGAYQSHIRDTLLGAGYRALLSVPLLREGKIIGSLSLNRHTPGAFPPEAVEVLKTFATQSALAIQNARLFREIGDKSRQLEAASRHKSEFLANMSHELRTPLNAVIGFSEVLLQRMFGALNDKQDEYLKDIYASGQHLLSLINDILDLSKIEAGRMELEPADFDLPSAIDNALTLVRERATRRGILLGCVIDEGLGTIRGDERKVKQVLLNLLSNALKFTPEGGRIDVRAALHEGRAEVSVADTGVGIASEDQEAVFEEFRQVGTADKKVEGTGLGLALSQKFVQLHGGRLWVESELGRGSTFTFTLPVS